MNAPTKRPLVLLPPVSDTAAVLIRARHYLSDPENWCGDGYSDGKRLCAIAAVAQGGEGSGRGKYLAMLALYDALPEHAKASGAESVVVGNHNDHPDTTHADILALFGRAIAQEMAR